MVLTTTFHSLVAHLGALHEALSALLVTIREDRPLEGDVVFVYTLGDLVDDLLGQLAEGRRVAQEGLRAAASQDSPQPIWRSLTACQQALSRVEYGLFELISYDRLQPLFSFGQEQEGEWLIWVHSVKEALDRCQQPAYEAHEALSRCWQEIADRAGLTPVSVWTHNIGQQITMAGGPSIRHQADVPLPSDRDRSQG